MKCKEVYEYVCENLDEQPDSPRCRQIRRHLESCPSCQTYLDGLKKTVALYRIEGDVKMPKAVHTRLVHALNSALPPGGPGALSPAKKRLAR